MDAYYITILVSIIFISIIIKYYLFFFSANNILKDWTETIIVLESNPFKIDKWTLIYDSKGKIYKFESKNKLIIDDKIFINKFEALNHLKQLTNDKIIMKYYIMT